MTRGRHALLAWFVFAPSALWGQANPRVQTPSELGGLGLPPAVLGRLNPAAPSLDGLVPLSALDGAALYAPEPDLLPGELPVPQPQTALERLSTPVPFREPEAGDLAGQSAYAENAFAFKTGGSGGGDGGAPSGHDGGGADYPHRVIRFLGRVFRSVVFRPNVPAEHDLVQMIDAADKTLHIALYEFGLRGVMEALQRARARGVKIRILLDYEHVFPRPGRDYEPERSREIWTLLRSGFDVKVVRGLSKYGAMHAKIAVADHNAKGNRPQLAVFGSYNWSFTSETSHYENLNFTDDKRRVDALMSVWHWIDRQAKPVSYESKASDFTWPDAVEPPDFDLLPLVDYHGLKLPILIASPESRPGRSFEDWMVQAIERTPNDSGIALSAFAIRSTRIASALRDARVRGVKVRVLMDKGQADSGPFAAYAQWLAAQGVEVRTLAGPDPESPYPRAQKMHHKFAVFGRELVETGSTNFTKYGAKGDFDVAHFLDDKTDVAAYLFAYEHMWEKAAPLALSPEPEPLPTDAELEEALTQPIPPPYQPPAFPPPPAEIKPRTFTFNGRAYDSIVARPDRPIEPELEAAILSARKSVRLNLYEFDLQSVLDAVAWLRKNRPSVKVEIVLDRSNVYPSGTDRDGAPRMPSAQILTLIDMAQADRGLSLLVLHGKNSGINHSKYLLVDAEEGGLVAFGSYNLTKNSEHKHFEIMYFSDEADRVADYASNFRYHQGLSEPVDRERLEQVLNRTKDQAASERAVSDAEADWEAAEEGARRGREVPPPPPSQSKVFTYNNEEFQLTYFSPQGGVMSAWERALKAARTSVSIGMFSFFSRSFAEALAEAKKARPELKFTIVLDKGMNKLTKVNGKFDGLSVREWLLRHGFSAKEVVVTGGPNRQGDPNHEKLHVKTMEIDGAFALLGSFNLSDRAELYNFENENLILDPADVAYLANYLTRLHAWAKPPKAPAAPPPPQEPEAFEKF